MRKFSLLYAWLVRSLLFFLPDYPPAMRMRGALYGLTMKKCGRNFQVAHSATLVSLDKLEVGEDVYVANNTVLLCGGGVLLEDQVMVAHNVVISSNNHSRINESFRWGERVFSPVRVAKGAWVGANATLVAGSTLPEGSVLAAGSVLTKKWERRNSAYGGVPARLLND